MTTYFDELPSEILFHVISYFDIKEDINRFIYSTDQLAIRFISDDIWKYMLYQNIRNPVIGDPLDLWRDRYYNNINDVIKYNVEIFNETGIYDYIIIKTSSSFNLLSYNINNNKTDPDDILDEEDENVPSLSFLTDDIKYLYINSKDKEFVQKISQLKFIDLYTCIGIKNSDNTIEYILEVLYNMSYLGRFRPDVPKIYTIFTIDEITILYIENTIYI